MRREKHGPQGGRHAHVIEDYLDEPSVFAVGTGKLQRVTLDEIEPAEPRPRHSEVAMIAHDLKNPLMVIALETTALADEVENEHARAMVARVARNVAQIERMVQDMLDLDALDADQFRLMRPRAADLRAVLTRVVERAVATCQCSRVLLDAPESAITMIDDRRIERVIINLMQNALKYSPHTSAVTLMLRRVDGVARITVIDRGPGIPDHELTSVFNRYHRTAGAAAHDGSGLGLYISKRIVEAHGGVIGVECPPEGGTRFYFDLPLPPVP